jgi:sugar lactone lactonase YvrE
MPTTRVTVYRNGEPCRGRTVKLFFTDFFNQGSTDGFMTDSDGIAYVESSSSGKVQVYVDGSHKEDGYAGSDIDVHL